MRAIAHTRNRAGNQQDLVTHLENVARLAAQFASPWGASDLGYLAGLKHDIGKYNPAFQQYLREAELHPDEKRRGPDHKGAGAVLAAQTGLDILSFLIMGHHGGLPSASQLKSWLIERAEKPEVLAAIEEAKRSLPGLQQVPTGLEPGWIKDDHDTELFIRLLFSALIDADFLDTEQHFSPWKSARRGNIVAGPVCGPGGLKQFEEHQRTLMNAAAVQGDGWGLKHVNRVRREVYEACLEAATWAPGLFRLTVPTGGGKTLSSLGFSLKHACHYNKRRVIYAIPYMSITEQISDVFRSIFKEPGVVLEHHSGVAVDNDDHWGLKQEESMWSRLSSENWDAPLIVTTTVQSFESLLSNRTSSCRKLHNVAESVIILDEVQMLPTHVLTPILDVLQTLVDNYGVTVVLCTATQPALHDRDGFAGLKGIREIVPNAARHFEDLRRVEYHLPLNGEKWTWAEVAEWMSSEDQALCIVNTRRDAITLFEALGHGAIHLSTWMCGAHRRDVLREVRRRLEKGEPCRVVSTQLIEAGVDVDFPLVMRAMGPVDRIAQAAGRCNREGKMDGMGTVIVFEPAEGGLPPGPYRIGTQITMDVINRIHGIEMHDPSVFAHYFRQFYSKVDCDTHHLQKLRESFDFPETSRLARLIEDEQYPVVVRYEPHLERIERLLNDLDKAEPGEGRRTLRLLQPFLVNLRENELKRAIERGQVSEVKKGLWKWTGIYDSARGIELQ